MNGAPLILWLDDADAADRSRTGGKGACLAQCRSLGLPVPDGFCITTKAFLAGARTHTREVGVRGSEPFPFPPGLETALLDAYERLGRPAVAVRSSGADEDGHSISLAGQHETVLGVSGESALLDAVRACWASAFSERATEYRHRREIPQAAPLAVIVQRMVEPEVSGVLFTRDPVSGAEDAAVVSASYGLGESVVSGLVVPDVFRLSKTPPRVVGRGLGAKETRLDLTPKSVVATEVPPAERERLCLDDDQLLRLLAVGMRLEEYYGCAQDVEWALCDGDVVLLQSRPVTAGVGGSDRADSTRRTDLGDDASPHAAARSMRARAEDLIRADVAEHLPCPYPLDLGAARRLVEAVTALLSRAGLNPPAPQALLRGDADGAIRLHPALPSQHPGWLTRLPAVVARSIRHDPALWPQEEAAMRRRLDRLTRRVDRRAEADSAALLRLLDEVIDAAAHVLHDRYRHYLLPLALNRAATMGLAATAGLGRGVREEDLYRDLSYVTAAANAGVSRLAERVCALGLGRRLHQDGPRRFLNELDATPAGHRFHAELHQFLDEYGARAGSPYLAFSARSWRERPEDLMGIIAAQLRGAAAAPRGRAQGPSSPRDVVQEVAARLPAPLRRRWYRSVARQRALHVGREGTLYLIEEFFLQARRIMDEIADRLAVRGLLESAEDVVLLYDAEVRRALSHPAGAELTRLVDRRRDARAQAEEAWRRSCGTVSGGSDRGVSDQGGPAGESALRGLPSAAGRARGRARVILGPRDFGRLSAGEVLVCPFTDPSWTPLFSLAAGVVADAGGPLSHAAIVAREYGIPAVLGADGATAGIRDGDLIEVDGSVGVVMRISAMGDPSVMAAESMGDDNGDLG
ncbi:PEP/pyruvate-binding domain-containing protein [Actinomyces ruminicola]|uniref:Pyruvate, water dikinase n=1 Tax=Actinomyces ruminicola TaxID=332524 RepID=A0A1G9STK6_9ACTO|nr:PEP/pyruvate-binding domain-containing protein [Actinomyces ruminicola]SDM38750.1 pyruvate, water dikinase [Actinomyces ruminicola]